MYSFVKKFVSEYSEVGWYFEPSGSLCLMRQNRNTEDRGPIRLCTDNDYKNHFQTHTSKIHFSQLSVDINTATVKRVSVCPVLYLDG